jgi:S-DNA-T family DNA segregation ATPase FtsK/SpoIIIE
MRKNTVWPPAPEVRRLPVDLRWVGLPAAVAGRPVLGLADDDLAPATFVPEGTFVVVGPPGSGRTTALGSVLRAAVAYRPEAQVAVFTPGRRPAVQVPEGASAMLACGQDEAAELATKLHEQLAAAGGSSEHWLIAIESPGEFLNGPADLPLQDLLKAARSAGHLVLAEGETSSMSGSWPLLAALRFSRRGLALQPDQTDGDMVFKTTFPRLRRSDFVPGRGMLVADGRAKRVQVAWMGELP